MAAVVLNKVGKTYPGGVDAVKGVSFDIPDGSLTVLVGPSGCGKSTLLRMVAGLEEITSGDVTIGARRVNELEPADRDIAMVFQNYALYPHMNVYDNMAYGLRNRGTPRDEIDRRVREAADILAIQSFLERKPRALSGGQRQRVAMGRAIVRKPQVFLFDEPLSNLDAKLRVQMRVEIKKLQRKLGVTSIYVTHDQVEAMTMSDQLVVMNGGEVEQIGAAADIYRKPASTFVAGFIGSPPMNMLEGSVSGAGEISIGGTRFALPGVNGLSAGTKLRIGLRPEDIEIASGGQLGMEIEFTEELGAVRLLHGTIAGRPMVVQVASTSGAPDQGHVSLKFEAASLHPFSAETGRRIGGAPATAMALSV